MNGSGGVSLSARAPARTRRAQARRLIVRSCVAVPMWGWVAIFYLTVALVTIGRYALPHPARVCACVGTSDPSAYMWALSWWPHAIAHGLNPFVTHYLWSPTGVDLAKAAMIPTAALAMTPVTELAGPLVAYNVLTIAGPVLAAFTAYRLCRRLVGRELPALVGGYLFGFSTYELTQSFGHPNLSLIFLLPVMVHLVLRRGWGELSRLRFVATMAVVLVAQAGLSTELLAIAVALGAVTLLSTCVITPQRRLIGRLAVEIAAAGVLSLLLASPLIYYALFSGSFPHGAPGLSDVYGLDFLNPLFPTYATRLGRGYFFSLGNTFTAGNVSEAGGYLGVALLAAFFVWLMRGGLSRPLGRILAIVALVSFLAALGSHLHVAGISTMPLPYDWIRHAPIADNVVPTRIFLFTALAVAVGISAWLAQPGASAWARWSLVALGIVLLLPNVIRPLYGVPPHRPRFFSAGLYRQYIPQGATVLILPFGQNDVSDLWQAEAGFRFYMPEGYVSGVVPPPFDVDPVVNGLLTNVPPSSAALSGFMIEHKVGVVLVDPAGAGPWPAALAKAGLRGRTVGELLLYRVAQHA